MFPPHETPLKGGRALIHLEPLTPEGTKITWAVLSIREIIIYNPIIQVKS